ncbi:serine/threonine protein kinase [Nonomuraea sp. NPDC050536]|uniref:serine/threonine protein kinase n=1 Tax=Nonomuraea sp. NPDC050536 TaxID=3364366 RepID=UPI0037C983B1
MAEKDSSQPEHARRVGDYDIVGRLGDGPRGTVYLGKESDDSDVVAIKTVPGADPEFVPRLKSVKRVSSSYVARTIDAGIADGVPYIVRENVEGRSLAEVVEHEGPLTGDALERVAVGTLTALTAIHLAGLAHRGLTPRNVILTADGPRVTDFEMGDPAGEVAYRAPEQVAGLQYGPYADVFAWAATVVFAGTGAAPFDQAPEAVLNAEPQLGALPEQLREVVAAALAKDVAGRPTAYTALLRLLGDKAPAMQSIVPVPPQAEPIEGVPLEGVPVAMPVPLPEAIPQQPTQQMWGPPPGAPQQPPQQNWTPPNTVRGQTATSAVKKPFPIGLVAGVAAVVLVSGLGLWGASHYSTLHLTTVAEQAAASRPSAGSGAASSDAAANVPQNGQPSQAAQPGTTQQPQQPQVIVTAPWAATPSPDDDGVVPLVLPTDSSLPPTSVPVLTQVPTPVPTQPVVVPTQQATVTVQPTATTDRRGHGKPTDKPKDNQDDQKPTPTATVTKTVEPSPAGSPTTSPTPPPSATPTPAPTPSSTWSRPSDRPTEKPTEKPTPTPVPTRTVTQTVKPEEPKPTPTPTKTTEEPKPTPTAPTQKYTATEVCGGGFYVQRSQAFYGGTTYQLYNSGTGENCVVTLKSGPDVGKASPVSATIEVQGAGSKTDSGNYEWYAGPVKMPAKSKCVRFAGSAGGNNTSSGWANCG